MNYLTVENVLMFFELNKDFVSDLDVMIEYDHSLSPFENIIRLTRDVMFPAIRPEYVWNESDPEWTAEKRYNDMIKSMLEQSWIGDYAQKK